MRARAALYLHVLASARLLLGTRCWHPILSLLKKIHALPDRVQAQGKLPILSLKISYGLGPGQPNVRLLPHQCACVLRLFLEERRQLGPDTAY